MTKSALALLLGLALTTTPLGGCASSKGSAPAPDPGTQQTSTDPDAPVDPDDPDAYDDPDELPPVSGPPGLTAMDRVQSAVDGMLLGAIIGMQAGPIGAAVGAGTLLIYSAITGHVPLKGASGPSGGGGGGGGRGGGSPDEQEREEDLEREIEREAARGEVLETQIEEELRRQEDLLKQIESGTPEKPGDENLSERADPRSAPEAPKERELPMAIFEKEKVVIESGTWEGQTRDLEVVKRTLDADRDGKPEEIRYFDAKSVMIRKEQDQDYDGVMDTWSSYQKGEISSRLLDGNADGKPDTWETYEGGRMVARETDRDQDGTKDAFYSYAAGVLVEEKHDANNDGDFDLIVTYENKVRARSIEDRNKDGKPDTWTLFKSNGKDELVARVEKDTNDSGKADVFETYDTLSGKSVLAKREEDRNEDGTADVTSIYENGKLVRREISDPALVPL